MQHTHTPLMPTDVNPSTWHGDGDKIDRGHLSCLDQIRSIEHDFNRQQDKNVIHQPPGQEEEEVVVVQEQEQSRETESRCGH